MILEYKYAAEGCSKSRRTNQPLPLAAQESRLIGETEWTASPPFLRTSETLGAPYSQWARWQVYNEYNAKIEI